MMIDEGSIHIQPLRYSQKDVEKFAEVTGDNNPIHIDSAYAANTIFKKPIIHGFLGGSVFSKVFGTIFPGEGTIYLKQSMEFKRPMYVDTDYEAHFTVISVDKRRNRALIETKVVDKLSGTTTIIGEAHVMNADKIK
jgi:acyl dehydratase